MAIAQAALQIDSLPHADGATETILQDLQVMSSSMRSIWGGLNGSHGSDARLTGYRTAILAMLDSILVGADSSVAALIDGTSSWNNGQQLDLALIDAVLASSGALEFYGAVSASLGQLDKALNAAQVQGLLCKDGGPDIDLACEMQVYVVLDNYATYFVKPTTTTYANTVGLTAGLLAVTGVGLAGEAIIGALLTVFDFVYGTLAPSLFPAEITQFSLDVHTDSIAIGEMTSTTIQISAVNKPATITATAILDQLLSALGLAKGSQTATSFRDVLKTAMSRALDLYRKAIVQHNTNTGGSVFIDPEADLPPLYWGPVTITNSDLVELFSFTEDIIVADTSAFEWEGVSQGEGRIQARGRGAGDKSKVLYDNALCWGCIYSGGAFGENAPGTETKTVIVGKPAKLLVEINGLPDGTDANVIVTGVEFSSGRLTATDSLSGLEPGDYHVTAIEVKDGDGDSYLPSPIDTSVTLADGDHKTVTISYDPEFGNLLLTVTGLPEGVEADIDIAGPEGSYHIVSDTLLDSLVEGSYSVTAHNVDDGEGNTIKASPPSQTVEIAAGETAIAQVKYGGEFTMRIVGGAWVLNFWAEAWDNKGASGLDQFVPAGGDTLEYYLPNPSDPYLRCATGGPETWAGSVSTGAGGATATALFSVSSSENSGSISMSAVATGSIPAFGDPAHYGCVTNYAFALASCQLPGTAIFILLDNPGNDNIDIEISASITGAQDTDPLDWFDWGAQVGVGNNNDCPRTASFDYATRLVYAEDTTSNPVLSGSVTRSTSDSFLRIPLWVACYASGKGGEKKCWTGDGWNTAYSGMDVGQVSVTVEVTATKR